MRKGSDGKGELVLLDHGLYDSLKEPDRLNLCCLYKSIILRDEPRMEEFSHKLGIKGQSKYLSSFETGNC